MFPMCRALGTLVKFLRMAANIRANIVWIVDTSAKGIVTRLIKNTKNTNAENHAREYQCAVCAVTRVKSVVSKIAAIAKSLSKERCPVVSMKQACHAV